MTNGVVFEEGSNNTPRNITIASGEPKGILALLINSQIVKNEMGAKQFLLGILVISVLLTIFFVVYGIGVIGYHNPGKAPPIFISQPPTQ